MNQPSVKPDQGKLDELNLRLGELLDKQWYHRSSSATIGKEIATVRIKIADIIDKRQGVLPL